MVCGACGSPNPGNRKFCGECGARLATACPTCGAVLDAGQKFCGECGSLVAQPAAGPVPAVKPAAEPPLAPPAGPQAERRLVTVLFADLVGFTPFSEERDSEDVRETLTRYFDLASVVVARYGGTIEKFIGDAVMAVWGTPTAREDDAERAVRAALELLDAVGTLGGGLSARAGLLTGEAAVTLGATNQGMVAGDLVNTAARLQSAAPPDAVLVGEATYRASAPRSRFEPAGEQSLKGKQAPVAAWRAIRVVAERGGRGRADLLEAPFVGRDDELRLLKDLFHATSREGRARLISVTGPAGIGKSRLAWEFEKYLDGLVEPVWWHHGRSPAYGQGITFWALGEMVRSRCGLEEGADDATTRARVTDMLAAHVPSQSERAWIEPALLTLLGVQGTVVAADELFARWRLLFERLSATGIVVMVFEDLHWADPGTLDFIDHMLDWAKAIPILIVTLARPELLAQRPDFGVGRRSFASIALEPLPEPAVRALLAGLVPDLPAEAVRRIVARAEGIPLYAVETVRMLLAEGRLVLRDGTYAVAGDITALSVPETLTALIAARLDALDATDRSLILDAAVLGQRFTLDALAAVSGLDPAVLEPRLRGLVRRELLALEADPRSPERGQYGFVQALIREVAYNTLAKRDRKERHLAAARHFESIGSDELSGALARHYLAAHENAPDGAEADALAVQARITLRAAGDRALALGSWLQATELLRSALTVTTADEERAEILERLGDAAVGAAHAVEAVEPYESAAAIHAAQGRPSAAARLLARVGQTLVSIKRHGEALERLDEAVAMYEGVVGRAEMAALRSQQARALYFLGEARRSVEIADAVLEVAEHEALVAVLADTLITKASALGTLGRPREADALFDLGIRLAEERGTQYTRLRGIQNRTVAASERDAVAALAQTQAGLAIARQLGAESFLRNFVSNLGYVGYRTGDFDLVERELAAALEWRSDPADEAMIIDNLISVRIARGQDAAPLLHRMEEIAGSPDNPTLHGLYLDTLAMLDEQQGRYREAADRWREAMGGSPEMEPQSWGRVARALLWAGDAAGASALAEAYAEVAATMPIVAASGRSIRAGAAWMLDRRPDAIGQFLEAHDALLAVGARWDAAMVALDAGYAGAAGDATVDRLLDEARAFLELIGAMPFVAKVDEVRAASAAGVRPSPTA